MRKHPGNSLMLLIAAACLIFAGSFLGGIGLQQYFSNQKIRSDYQNSDLAWRREWVGGEEDEVVRDMRNHQLVENMSHISMEQQIYMDASDSAGSARISNHQDSIFCCTVALVRDATGEMIYESGLIDPGFYIEEITLNKSLSKGYYPCTVVWEFYTKDGEYAGEMAGKAVVIIKN